MKKWLSAVTCFLLLAVIAGTCCVAAFCAAIVLFNLACWLMMYCIGADGDLYMFVVIDWGIKAVVLMAASYFFTGLGIMAYPEIFESEDNKNGNRKIAWFRR